jgi:restriction endonuclease Mrr
MKKPGLKIKLLSLLNSFPDDPVRLDVLFREYEARYRSEMSPADFEINSSGNIRWRHSLQGEITECRSKGLVSSLARGYWQITDNGRHWLQENQGSYDNDRSTLVEHNQLLNIPEANFIKQVTIKEKDGSMLQTFGDFFVPLMKILDSLPNRIGRSGDVLRIFEETCREQIDPDLYTQNQSGNIRWVHNIRWSREKLKLLGLLDAPQHGVWRLTEKGHQWLEDHPAATHLTTEESKSGRRVKTASYTPTQKEMDSASKFLAALQDALQNSLIEIFGSIHYEFISRANYLQIRVAGFAGCHYEIILRRQKHEVALHFESSAERSQARLRSFEPHLEELARALKVPLNTHNIQSTGWTQIRIEKPPRPLSQVLAKEYADLTLRFVAASFPILQEIYSNEGLRTRRAIAKDKPAGDSSLYQILDQEVEAIRAYLQGRSSMQPSDEKLCDWVNFCYMFRMYVEGKDLFALVSGNEVDHWHYERTRKMARICEQKAKAIETREK